MEVAKVGGGQRLSGGGVKEGEDSRGVSEPLPSYAF